MSDPLVDLGAVAKRVDAASPGPWTAEPHGHMRKGCRCISCTAITGWYIDHREALDCEDSAARDDAAKRASSWEEWPPGEVCTTPVLTYADADFGARAREDVPALLDENLRMRDLLSYLALHIGRYEWTQLTTEQKELLADVIEEKHRRMEAEDGLDYTSVPVHRWWRDD